MGIEITGSTGPTVLQADLTVEPIPFPDNHFNHVFEYGFLEHLPMRVYVGTPTVTSGPST
jgi:hypothetical protein